MHNKRDWQSVAYLALLPLLVAWVWQQPGFSVVAYGGILLLVIGVCCIGHNHAHVPIWRSRGMNQLTDMWIGTLQGQPVFLFQPAHVDSHHRFNQGEGDLTRVMQYDRGNTIMGYLLFPFKVLPALGTVRRRYLGSLWHHDRKAFWWTLALYLPLLAVWIAVGMLDPGKALIYVYLPQLVALHFLLASNYLQHAHAVAGSRYNHSRNFVGAINWLWFNVGYHTAHHEHEDLHWCTLPAAHDKLRSRINPALIERSFCVYVFRTLVLGQFIPRLRSRLLHE
ncbi:MAG: fatty acid desaturase [Rhodocyclaceae bacterium]